MYEQYFYLRLCLGFNISSPPFPDSRSATVHMPCKARQLDLTYAELSFVHRANDNSLYDRPNIRVQGEVDIV